MRTLYAIDNKGQTRVWSVEILDDGIMMEHGVLGGTMTPKYELPLLGFLIG